MPPRKSMLVFCTFFLFLSCGRNGGRLPENTSSVMPADNMSATPVRGPSHWATRVEAPGLANFYKVSDQLYRGAQPSVEGVQELKKLGIKTIVNLRKLHSDRDEIGDTGMVYERIGMNAWNAEEEDVVHFLKVVSDPEKTPVFVHCKYGSARTGMMCALYRIALQGWSQEEALREMTEGGFGFHGIWDNLASYVENLNIEKVKKKAGIDD